MKKSLEKIVNLKNALKFSALIGGAVFLSNCRNPVASDVAPKKPNVEAYSTATELVVEAYDLVSGIDSVFIIADTKGTGTLEDEVWQPYTSPVSIESLELPPGTYPFAGRAVNNDGLENRADSTFSVDLYEDTTPPLAPSISPETGIGNGRLSLDIYLNGDDESNHDVEVVSGINETRIYAAPLSVFNNESDLQNFGIHLSTLDSSSSEYSIDVILDTYNADYHLYSITEDDAGNETFDYAGIARTGGPTMNGHRILGSVSNNVGGNIEVYGVVDSFEEKIAEFPVESNGTFYAHVMNYIFDENFVLRYNGQEKEYTFQDGALEFNVNL